MVLSRLLVLLLVLAAPAFAQTAPENEGTRIERWLEDALSDAGREVAITGFRGALSSNASLDTLTIADDDGVWFTMSDASLVWSRRALLSGRLEISALTAAKIVMPRRPNPRHKITPEDAEAWEFALPDLPVSIEIDDIRADQIVLGADVIGEPAIMTLQGHVQLIGGEANATLFIRRTDRDDQLSLQADFSNVTRVLGIEVDFTEARGGLVSSLLRIPGAPDLRLQVAGRAPLSAFDARIALTSEGTQRLGGEVRIASVGSEDDAGYAFSAGLRGDIRPLMTPELHPFFGAASELAISGETWPDGRVTLNALRISAAAMQVAGTLDLAANGWPERFQLNGRIGDDGQQVALPFGGPGAKIGRAVFTAGYDAAQGESWQAEVSLRDFRQDGLRLGHAGLIADGMIVRAGTPSVTADVTFETRDLGFDNPALMRAVGPDPSGWANLVWQQDAPPQIKALGLASGDLSLIGTGRIGALADGIPVAGRATVRAGDLSRFAALAGRDLGGMAQAMIEGRATLLGGAFDVVLSADTTDLDLGLPKIEPLLAGRGQLSLVARRGTGGTVIDRLDIETPAVQAHGSGRLNADAGRLSLAVSMPEIAPIEPRLAGPATLDTALEWQAGGKLTVSRLGASVAGAMVSATGALWPDAPALPVEGQLMLRAPDLSRLSRLAGRQMAGTLELDMSGSGEIRGQVFDLAATATGQGLRTGLPELDRLVAGDGSLELSAGLTARHLDLRYLKLVTPRLRANATGAGPGAPIAVSARIADLAALASGFSGPATARGAVTLLDRSARRMEMNLDATGPGPTTARVRGALLDYGQSAALEITGRAPLGLANRFIAPRSIEGPAEFDLRLDGPPGVASLSGRIAIGNARVALPTLNAGLNQLTGTVSLATGQADVNISGNAGTGGGFVLRGPVALAAPHRAALEVALSNLGLSDSRLFTTTLDGTLRVTGPLAGGATIGGALRLGRTELRVPSGGGIGLGEIPEIRHVGEPAAVAATRRRAGLIGPRRAPPATFALDLTIDAPNRIFVRGRGIDAELGGRLQLGGTTTDVVASGVFELIRGRLDILGRRLDLTEGLIDLRGALEPYIRFVAETSSDDITVRAILEGPAGTPSVRFTSDPDLPQEEAVARLLFGRGLGSISPFQAAQIVGAAATLSGQRSGGLGGNLRNVFGLSDLDVSSSESGATRLRAGTYISQNVYSEVTADDEGNQEINLRLDLTPSVTIQGSTDTAGDTGIGLFFEKDY